MSSSERTKLASAKVDAHIGRMILAFARMNPSPKGVLIGLVQNAIDKGAQHITILFSQADGGSIVCFDDGQGASENEVRQVWSNIASSFKSANQELMGEKGTDKMRIFASCNELLWTMRPMLEKGSRYFTASVSVAELERNPEPELTMVQERVGFTYGEIVNFTPTTRIRGKGVSKSTVRNIADNLEDIAEEIGEVFYEKITRQQVVICLIHRPSGIKEKNGEVRVQVQPREFPGTKCKPIEIRSSKGVIDFQLYSSLSPTNKPRLFVQPAKGQRIALDNLSFDKKVSEILFSGFFSGVVYCNFVTPTDNREDLVEGSSKEAFMDALGSYVLEDLSPYLISLQDEHKHTRISEKLLEEVNRSEQIIKQDPSLQLALKGKLAGFVSENHTTATTGEKTEEKLRRKPITIQEFKERQKQKKSSPGEKTGEKKKMIHSSVQHPLGKERRIKGNQFGITVLYADAPVPLMRKVTWVDRGVIYFNYAHPEFTKASNADKSGKAFQRFVRLHLAKVLSGLMSKHSAEADHFTTIFDDHFTTFFGA